jgi:hypothetical protein
MRKTIIMFTIFMLLSAFTAFSQTSDFSGHWEYDKAKSKAPSQVRVSPGSWTLKVTQTEKELKVETATKGERGVRNGTDVYSLEGKETRSDAGKTEWQGTATLTAMKEANGKLILTSTRKVTSQSGEFMMTTKETWEMVEGGKAIKIFREINLPAAAPVKSMKWEMYFAKKIRE